MHDDVELFRREPANPLLTAGDWPYPVNSVFNPGAALVGDETVLLCRVEDRRGISHLTAARSADGRTDWRIDPKPLITDDPTDPSNCWGVEDPRITHVEELGGWVIAYTAYGPGGPCVALAVTQDFTQVDHLGIVMPPEDKNASLLPRRVDGHFRALPPPGLGAFRPRGRLAVPLGRPAVLDDPGTSDAVPLRPVVGCLPDRHGPTSVGDPVRLVAWCTTGSSRWSPPRSTGSGMVLLDLDDPTKVIRTDPELDAGPGRRVRAGRRRPERRFPHRRWSMIHDRTSCACTTAQPTSRVAMAQRTCPRCSTT